MIDYYLYEEIKHYANRHYESSKDLYLKRNQNSQKIFQDILRGKIAEYCAYFHLIEKGYVLDKPDLTLSAKKSYDADLVIKGSNTKILEEYWHIHVKSVTRASYLRYGASFLVEANDPLVFDPKPLHAFLVMIEDSFLVYKKYAWLKCANAVYQEPKMNLPTKKAIYL